MHSSRISSGTIGVPSVSPLPLHESQVTNDEALPPATIPQHLVCFSLDTTGLRPHNPPQQFGFGHPGELLPRALSWLRRVGWPPRETKCSICPASPCSVSIRSAKPAVTGSAPMPPAPSPTTAAAPAAGTSSATFHRRSVRASACALAPSPRARLFVPALVNACILILGHRTLNPPHVSMSWFRDQEHELHQGELRGPE